MKKQRIQRGLLGLLVAFGMSACSDDSPTIATYGLDLSGTTYQLYTVGSRADFGFLDLDIRRERRTSRFLPATFWFAIREPEPQVSKYRVEFSDVVVHIEDDGGFSLILAPTCLDHRPTTHEVQPCVLKMKARRMDLSDPVRPAFRIAYELTIGPETIDGDMWAYPPFVYPPGYPGL